MRTDKRILWTPEEDLRLMSAWLHNSTDPTIGADRRNEQYWSDVADTYNQNTPSQRKRNQKQAKDRWHKINKWIDLFHNAWLKAKRLYTRGHNDQMWIDKAHRFYEDDNKDLKLGRFVLMDVWNAIRNEPKWIIYNNGLKNARKRKTSDDEKGGEEIVNINLEDVGELPRPGGQKAAKRDGLSKKTQSEEKTGPDTKGKPKPDDIDIELFDKFERIQSEEHANRLKVLEVQEKLSQERMEANKIVGTTAKDQISARMVTTYNRLLGQDVSKLSEEEKVDRAETMRFLKKKLFTE